MTAIMSTQVASSHPCRLRLIAPPAAPAQVSAQPRLWFAILTYNALAYTKRCLASLDLHTTEPWHAVILDNTSTDGTREWLGSLDDPRVSVELSESNTGVAGGRNRLLDLTLDRVPEDGWIVFVDNDLEFYPNWVAPFLSMFAQNPRAGMASVVGHEIVVHGSRRELLSLPAHRTAPVDVVSGGFACFVKPAVFRAIGRYDEALNPFWHEDDDLAVRTRAAGWEVFAVPSAGVIHHGHKSGVALPSLLQGGSLDKQRYLVDKWRHMGIVQRDGRLQFDHLDADLPHLTRLGQRLGRSGALRRSEADRAAVDVAFLTQALERGPELGDRVRFASAPARALLAERVEAGAATPREVSAQDAVERLLDTRRRMSRLPRATAVSRAPSRLADAADWNDAEWCACAVEFAGDGRGAQQWYDRTLSVWRAAQSAFVLRHLHALSPDARLLVIADLRSPLVWALARQVESVVVADVLGRYPTHDGGAWLPDPERYATQQAPVGRVRAVSIDQLEQQIAEHSMSAAIVLPFDDDTPLAELGVLLTLAASRVAPGGPLLTCVPTRLAGPPRPGLLDGPSGIARWLAPLGLSVFDTLDTAMSDEGLLAATSFAHREQQKPDLLIADGPSLQGFLHVTCCAGTGASAP